MQDFQLEEKPPTLQGVGYVQLSKSWTFFVWIIIVFLDPNPQAQLNPGPKHYDF